MWHLGATSAMHAISDALFAGVYPLLPLVAADLNLSYGVGRLEVFFSEPAGDGFQGAVCALPVPDFPTGIMRGRFHSTTGDLYLCGLSAWATSQTLQEGGFYRLRPTGRAACLPTGWRVREGAIELTFSEAPRVAAEPSASPVPSGNA